MDKISIAGLAGLVLLKIPLIIGTGLCLGIGFYLAKKLTNKIDLRLAEKNPEVNSILAEHMGV